MTSGTSSSPASSSSTLTSGSSARRRATTDPDPRTHHPRPHYPHPCPSRGRCPCRKNDNSCCCGRRRRFIRRRRRRNRAACGVFPRGRVDRKVWCPPMPIRPQTIGDNLATADAEPTRWSAGEPLVSSPFPAGDFAAPFLRDGPLVNYRTLDHVCIVDTGAAQRRIELDLGICWHRCCGTDTRRRNRRSALDALRACVLRVVSTTTRLS